MIPTCSMPAVDLSDGRGQARRVPFAPTFQPLPVADDGPAAGRQRQRIKDAVVALCCDGAEAIVLASMTWLASLVLLGFVNCAFARDGRDPTLLRTAIESGTGDTRTHSVTTHEVSR